MNAVIRFLQKFKFYICALIVIVLFIVAVNMFDSKSNETATYNDGYTEVTSVPGVKFDVQKKVADSAQAVLEISKKVNFLDYQTYSYKNGEDMYLLFNIKKTIVVVKKGTSFNLDKGTAELAKKTLNGIWFTPLTDVTKSGKKTSVDVSAEVIITNEIYNDFTGRLCTIKNNDIEYSLFVGGDDTSIIDHICDSFTVCDTNAVVEETLVIDMETEEVSAVEDSPVIEMKDNQEEKPSEENPPFETEEPVVTEPVVEEEPPLIIEVEEPIEEPIEPVAEPVEEPILEPLITEPGVEKIEIEPEEDESSFVVKTNQKDVAKEEGKAYSSTIYSMLNVGDTGFAMVKNGRGKYETAYIKALCILDHNETKKYIDEYISSGNSYYEAFEVPKGTHLEAVLYDAKYESDTSYLNIFLKGVDGENLKHNGVEKSPRTYDILSTIKNGEWTENNVTFYIVPNGCTEYVLQFGEGENEEKCFYHIINKEEN